MGTTLAQIVAVAALVAAANWLSIRRFANSVPESSVVHHLRQRILDGEQITDVRAIAGRSGKSWDMKVGENTLWLWLGECVVLDGYIISHCPADNRRITKALASRGITRPKGGA